jgi:hypothetical protein
LTKRKVFARPKIIVRASQVFDFVILMLKPPGSLIN